MQRDLAENGFHFGIGTVGEAHVLEVQAVPHGMRELERIRRVGDLDGAVEYVRDTLQDDDEVVEHDLNAVKSARSAGIKTLHYDKDKKDLKELKYFIESNI